MTREDENPKRLRIVAAVAGIDDTDSSSFVVEAASKNARLVAGAQLHLVHVVENERPASRLEERRRSWTGTDLLDLGRAYLDGMRRLAESTFQGRVFIHLANGEAWCEIVSAADRLHAYLIVVGRHDRTNLADEPSGSVSDRVVDHATCRVIVARPKSQANGTGAGRSIDPRSNG